MKSGRLLEMMLLLQARGQVTAAELAERLEFLALDRRFPALLDGARTQLAAYVGAAPENLAFATNASSALNAVIRSLDLQAGAEVLLGDAEYGLGRTYRAARALYRPAFLFAGGAHAAC